MFDRVGAALILGGIVLVRLEPAAASPTPEPLPASDPEPVLVREDDAPAGTASGTEHGASSSRT